MALLEKLQQILNEKNTKIIPENIKTGVKIFNIDGNLSIPVKIFTTKEEMMADTTEPDHEYAMVYGPKVTKTHEGDSIAHMWFPSEFTLKEPITSTKYFDLEGRIGDSWFNMFGNLNATGFNLNYKEDYKIQYTSEDGLHYIASSDSNVEERIDLGGYITLVSRYGGIDPVFFEFIFKDDDYLEGLYEWTNEIDHEYVDAVTDIDIDTVNRRVKSINREVYTHQDIEAFVRQILPNYVDDPIPEYIEGLCYRVKSTGDIWLITHTSSCYPVIDITTKNIYLSVATLNTPGYKYKMNLEEGTISDYTDMPIDDVNIIDAYGFPNTCQLIGNFNDIEILGDIFYHLKNGPDVNVFSGYISWYFVTNDGAGNLVYDKTNPYTSYYQDEGESQSTDHMVYGYVPFLIWHHLLTEFTLEHNYQLLPGVTAMGKHGVIEGDSSIYDHIELEDMVNRHLSNITNIYGYFDKENKGAILKNNITDITDIKNAFYKKIEFDPGLTDGYYMVTNPFFTFPYIFCFDIKDGGQTSFKLRIYDARTGLQIGQEKIYNLNYSKVHVILDKNTNDFYFIDRTNNPYTVSVYNINDLDTVIKTFTIRQSSTNRIYNNKLYSLINDGTNNKYIILENGEQIAEINHASSGISRYFLIYADDNYCYVVDNTLIYIYDRQHGTSTTQNAVGDIFTNEYIDIEYGDDEYFSSANRKVYRCNNGQLEFIVRLYGTNNVDYVAGYGEEACFRHRKINNIDYYFRSRNSSDKPLIVYNNLGEVLFEIPSQPHTIIGNYEYKVDTTNPNNFTIYYIDILNNLLVSNNSTDTKALKIKTHEYSGLDKYILINNVPFANNLTPEQEAQAESITDNILNGSTEGNETENNNEEE